MALQNPSSIADQIQLTEQHLSMPLRNASAATSQGKLENGPGFRFYWPAVPIPVLMAIITGLWLARLPTVFAEPNLLKALNFVLTAVVGLFIALLAARTFLKEGDAALLLLTAAVLTWGASGAVASYGQYDPNRIVTIHNLCALVSAMFHFGSVLLANRRPVKIEQKESWLVIALAFAALPVALIAVTAHDNLTPVFFIQGEGATLVRQVVLATTIIMFFASAALLTVSRSDVKPAFARWYAMSLWLIAVGLFGIMIQPAFGSLVGWFGRIAQYLGAVYMLIAAVAAWRESGSWQISLETQLEETRQDYKSLLDLAADGILFYEPYSQHSDGRVLQVNRALCKMMEYAADELLAMTAAYIFFAEDKTGASAASLLAAQGQMMRYETRLRAKSGRMIPVEISASLFEQKARPRGIAIIRDITERKRAEEALRNEKSRLSGILENLPVGVWIVDAMGAVISKNNAAERIWAGDAPFSRGPEDYVAYAAWDVETGKRLETDEYPLTRTLRTGLPVSPVELRIRRFDGTKGFIMMSTAPIRSPDGLLTGAVGINVDITEHKKTQEELKQLNLSLEQRISERTSELAHTVEVLQEEISQRERAEENLKLANEQLTQRADQLRRLAGQLTTVEQIERKRLSKILHDGLQQYLVSAKLHLGGLAELIESEDQRQMVQEIEKIIDEGLNISRSLTAELSPPILHEGELSDGLKWLTRWMREKHRFSIDLALVSVPELREDTKMLVFESVRELLFNALKHAQVSRAQVRVELDGKGEMRLTVSDEGAGFDPGQLLPEGAEAGFGLFSIRERIGLIGGRLEIDSAPGKGSRLALTVPYSQAGSARLRLDSACTPADQHSKGASADQETMIRVLLVDDHLLFRNGIARLLKNEPGLEVVGEAKDGREAIEFAQQLKPNVILMDISMPGINGVEATRVIHKQQPEVCIIGLSMHDDPEKAREMSAAGATHYKTKGCSRSELVSAIREGLHMRKSSTK